MYIPVVELINQIKKKSYTFGFCLIWLSPVKSGFFCWRLPLQYTNKTLFWDSDKWKLNELQMTRNKEVRWDELGSCCCWWVERNNLTIYTIGSEVVDEVLHHIHLVRRDVVEWYCTVTAAVHPLLHWIKYVFLVPEVVIHVSSDQMMLGNKWKESSSSQRIPVEESVNISDTIF